MLPKVLLVILTAISITLTWLGVASCVQPPAESNHSATTETSPSNNPKRHYNQSEHGRMIKQTNLQLARQAVAKKRDEARALGVRRQNRGYSLSEKGLKVKQETMRKTQRARKERNLTNRQLQPKRKYTFNEKGRAASMANLQKAREKLATLRQSKKQAAAAAAAVEAQPNTKGKKGMVANSPHEARTPPIPAPPSTHVAGEQELSVDDFELSDIFFRTQ